MGVLYRLSRVDCGKVFAKEYMVNLWLEMWKRYSCKLGDSRAGFFPACTINPKQDFENLTLSRKKTSFFVETGKL